MVVHEAFFSLGVRDMERATAFYTNVFGATVSFASPGWSSLHLAGVRIGLFPVPADTPGRAGLHLVVDDLAQAETEVVKAGGKVVTTATEVAPEVLVSDVADSEGNTISLRSR